MRHSSSPHQRDTRNILQLLKNHPCWQEKELAIVFPVSEVHSTDHDIVDESKFELLALAREILKDAQQYDNFQNALNAVTAGIPATALQTVPGKVAANPIWDTAYP